MTYVITGEANTQPRQLQPGDVTESYVVLEILDPMSIHVAMGGGDRESVYAKVQYVDGGISIRHWPSEMIDRICIEVFDNMETGEFGTNSGTLYEKACTYVWRVS